MDSAETNYYAHVPQERVYMEGEGAGQMVMFPVALHGRKQVLVITEVPMECDTCAPVKDWRCTCCGSTERTWAPHNEGGKVVLCSPCVLFHMVGRVCPHQRQAAATA